MKSTYVFIVTVLDTVLYNVKNIQRTINHEANSCRKPQRPSIYLGFMEMESYQMQRPAENKGTVEPL